MNTLECCYLAGQHAQRFSVQAGTIQVNYLDGHLVCGGWEQSVNFDSHQYATIYASILRLMNTLPLPLLLSLTHTLSSLWHTLSPSLSLLTPHLPRVNWCTANFTLEKLPRPMSPQNLYRPMRRPIVTWKHEKGKWESVQDIYRLFLQSDVLSWWEDNAMLIMSW